MKSEKTPAIGDEIDLIKVYIWVMLFLTVALGGVLWYTVDKVQNTEKLVAAAEKNLEKFSTNKDEILAMLSVFESNKEDEARDRPNTWFSRVWQRVNIPEGSIRPEAWAQKYYPRGNFDEERITLKFENKKPLSRKDIGRFCHEVEHASTRLRIIELKLRRAGKKDEYKPKEWWGEVTVGYRKARIRGE